MRVGTQNLPEEYFFATTDIAPRVEAFRKAVAAGEPTVLDFQFGIQNPANTNYDSRNQVVPVHSTREYLFFRCGLIKEIAMNTFHPSNLRIGWNGNIIAHDNFDVVDSSEKKARIYLGLYKENDRSVPCHTKKIQGRQYTVADNAYFVKITPTNAVATRKQEDLAGFAGEIRYGEHTGNLLDKPDLAMPSLADKFRRRAGIYVIAIPYVNLKECTRANVNACMTRMQKPSWAILHWHVLSSNQIVDVPQDGSIEMPRLNGSPEQFVA